MPNFHEFASEWFEGIRSEGLAANTLADYEWQLTKHLLPFFASHRIDAIDRELCLAFKAHKLQESAEIRAALEAEGLALVPLVAPTTPAARRRQICEGAQGFVYLVSVAGVTGERDELPAGLAELAAAVRAEAGVPVAVGFGIATPGQAAAVGRLADGVIIGTRLVRAVSEADGASAGARAVASFLREVRTALGG
jgi:tryptophan synthase alpha subunit